ncbi:TRAP transporter large permease [Marispirochaeta sp.]|jgi:tripartite ATP-independent transporter DctM subunit|uniref:TRAP transporter large permease n=1 Tax=Marispirochaeta sp. TaxID=2038653 RepID=UPI0029C72ACF|nr:TRAP transporter large permease [Marispirochaeta sp.]
MVTDPTAILLLLGTFGTLILIGTPIAFAIGASSVITTAYMGLPLEMVAQNMVKGVNVFAFLAVPFFIIAGEIMGSGGISTRLIKLSNALVGWIRGGLAMVNIMASMFFGGISGSSSADTSSIGSILIPMMKEDGYDGDFATTVTMASSVQGILIPPSQNMIIFALVAGSVSIGRLFLAGMIPGILLGVALMIFSYFVSVKRNYPKSEGFNLVYAIKCFASAGLGLGTVLIVVVGVVAGIFTATESASIAVIYAFIVTFFIYREIPLRAINGILTRSLKTLSVVMILVSTASAFGWLVAYLRIPVFIAEGLLAVTENRILILLMINILLLLMGMVMDMASLILILGPILLPVVTKVGVDPVHFGVVMILNLGIGLITPPVGSTLFIGSAIARIKMEDLARAMIPFYVIMVLVLLIITYVPSVVMFMPNWLMPLK